MTTHLSRQYVLRPGLSQSALDAVERCTGPRAALGVDDGTGLALRLGSSGLAGYLALARSLAFALFG